jgi:hypothetical protein
MKFVKQRIVACLLIARILEMQQPVFIRQWLVNNGRRGVFSEQSVLMALHVTVEYVIPLLSNNFITTKQ